MAISISHQRVKKGRQEAVTKQMNLRATALALSLSLSHTQARLKPAQLCHFHLSLLLLL